MSSNFQIVPADNGSCDSTSVFKNNNCYSCLNGKKPSVNSDNILFCNIAGVIPTCPDDTTMTYVPNSGVKCIGVPLCSDGIPLYQDADNTPSGPSVDLSKNKCVYID